ncbi:MAG TPA: M13 family metallopeptidase [Chryseolinea sp.]|nr:M13 family metallopeptidase [Chryseolinea sp.]
MTRFLPALVISSISLLTACNSGKPSEEKNEDFKLNLTNIDSALRPQDDFFKYVNGGWLNKTPIPDDQSSWGAFNELQESSNDAVLTVLKTAAADSAKYPTGSDQRKASDFFSVGMDSLLAERAGISPMKPDLDKVTNITDKKEIPDYLANDVLSGGGSFFDVEGFTDLKNSNRVSLYVSSGGLGLPERDYYLKSDARSKETRDRYVTYITNLFKLSGDEDAKSKAKADLVLKLETQLAKTMLSKEETRQPEKLYHPKSLAELKALCPSVDWPKFLSVINVHVDTVIVTEPAYLKEYEKIVRTYSLEELKTYMTAAVLRGGARFLNNAFVQESFDFNSRYLNGTQTMRPRWKRVLGVTDDLLGDAIGKLYVDENFPPEAKAKAIEMVENVKLAFADRIKSLDWMSDSTKQKALAKLNTFTVKIGYPDKWKNYAKLEVENLPEKASYYGNALAATRFHKAEELAKVGKSVDKSEWDMTPQTVNAYYNPLFNEIVFPAAILQAPFYDYRADEPINYGGIGAVIGHEISHGFDDQGSQFDAAGNLNNWWAKSDLTKFQEKGKAYIEQFNKFEPLPGAFVQGQFTLGENIGDLGGIAVAFDGLQRFYKDHPKPASIDGMTPEQRFFFSWGTIWRGKQRDEALRTQLNTDPHAPTMYRANAPLSNFDPFYDAFGLKEGDKMFKPKEERVKIW